MYNPYTPPKAQLYTEKPKGRTNRYYRITNWIYGVLVSVLLGFLLIGGRVKLELADIVVLTFFFAPVAGYLFTNNATAYGYKAWLVVHWIIVILLVMFTSYSLYSDQDALEVALFMLAINLLSVISNMYFQRKQYPYP